MKLGVGPLVLICLLLAGCSKSPEAKSSEPPKSDAEKLLKWSMDKYASFNSFQSECEWKAESTDQKSETTTGSRKFSYSKPNKFRSEAMISINTLKLTSVSDGTKLVEYSTQDGMPATEYPAPPDIASATSMIIKHPMFGGSVVQQFFGGSTNYYRLVDDSKIKPTLGETKKAADGEECQTVNFYSTDTYGNVKALIGLKSGLVHFVEYDSDGLKAMLERMPDEFKKSQDVPNFKTSETYSNMKVDTPIDAKAFDTKLPKGVTLQKAPSPDTGPTPLPIGKPAPGFTVQGLDGTTVSLASLKGQVVLIDFWATWCGPCREGLPITDALHKEFKGKGLKVLAVSDEDKPTVVGYVNENKFAFGTYLDLGRKMGEAFRVQSLPTTVILDRNGNVASYIIGLGPESQLRMELSKLGIQ